MAPLRDSFGRVLDRLRNPAHTGERRCWPCTAANATILLLASAAVARRRSRSLAAALGAAGAAAIWLRGYLVPATPRFAPRLAARLPGDPFHAAGPGRPAAGDDGGRRSDARDGNDAPDAPGSLADGSTEEAGERVLAALVDAGVVVSDGETVYLDDGFRDAWRAEMRDLRTRGDDGLAAALDAAAPAETEVDAVEQGGGPWREAETWFVVSDGSDDPANERWLTRPVAVAEAAAVRALADRGDLRATRRAQAAGPLRTFLESCPACDGPVEETTEVECCGGPGGARPDAPDDVLACADCDARLYTFR